MQKKKCAVSWCQKGAEHKGLCNAHYRRQLKYGDPESGGAYHRFNNKDNLCYIHGCTKLAKQSGLCSAHYTRLIRSGTTKYTSYKKGQTTKYPKEYRAWQGMFQRCYNENTKQYKNYGGRGIQVHSSWHGHYGFENFLRDVGPAPSKECSIDRINVDGDYAPGNCRWATPREQCCNKRNNLNIPGVRYTKGNVNKKWVAYLTCGDKRLSKSFVTREEAIKQREEWEKLNKS